MLTTTNNKPKRRNIVLALIIIGGLIVVILAGAYGVYYYKFRKTATNTKNQPAKSTVIDRTQFIPLGQNDAKTKLPSGGK